ncbi:MAG: TSUP family transporter [Ornithinimicrobium sp.]|uniref:TSUP family transporter n=1 Tax=Ornithinimicrobium sp. TaxID=1977084 RepID=UPI003D9AF6BA
MSLGAALAIAAALIAGSALQRIAGMGFGLVVAPVLTVVLGATTGVMISNAGAVLNAALIWIALRSDVDWRRFVRIAPLLLLGSVLGALTIQAISSAWLDVLVGGTVLLALAWTLLVGARVGAHGTPPALAAGTVGGFMNTTAGVAAPALTVYAVATDWQQRSFAATLQPIFLVANLSALIAKASLGAIPLSVGLPWWVWLVVLVAVPAGVGAGGLAARWVSGRAARHTAITVALLGGAVTLLRGLSGL